MDNNLVFGISCVLTSIREQQPLEQKLIEKIISSQKIHPTLTVVIKLLCRLFKKHQPGSSTHNNKTLDINWDAQVLKILAPGVEVPFPLKYLLNLQYQQFDEYCLQQKNDTFSDVLLHSQGLWPPACQNCPHSSIFSRIDNQGNHSGNVHWQHSRYVIYQWFIINRQRLPQHIQQIYSFLLCEPQFVGSARNLTKFWALIYSHYTQKILDTQTESQFDDKIFVTWARQPDEELYRKQFLKMEDLVFGDAKIIYYLAAGLLEFELESNRHKSFLASAFSHFKPQKGAASEYEMLAFTLFLKVAEQKNQVDFADSIRQHVRSLYQQKSIGQNVNRSFMLIYFTFEELLPQISTGQINHIELGLSEFQKRQMMSFMLTHNKVPESMVGKLQDEHFRQIFGGKKWNNPEFVAYMVPLMQKYKTIFQKKLGNLVSGPQQKDIYEHCELFYKMWQSYWQLERVQFPSLSMLSQITLCSQKDLKEDFQFMTTPKECPQVVFKILMGYVRFFNRKKGQLKSDSPTLKQFRQFQEEELPGLMSSLDEEHRTLFWKEWGDLVRADSQFVEELLNPQQKSTEV